MTLPTGQLFNEPYDKPLSAAGQVMAGCYRLFYLTGTTTPTNVYSDAALTTPLSQVPGQAQPSCTADGNGRFNPIYMDPNILYRVQLFTQGGILLQDVDPYVTPMNGGAFQSGSFTMGTTGFVSNPSGTAEWMILFGRLVILFLPVLGPTTSNATTFQLTNIPAAIQIQNANVANAQTALGAVNNGAEVFAQSNFPLASSVINLGVNGNLGGWTASGNKGVGLQSLVYFLT